MEFKGTKGKWVSNYSNGSWLIQDLETYQDGFKSSIAEIYWFNDEKDTAEYNALLISKAPEMLETINELLKELRYHGFNNSSAIWNAEQLIKEATEL